MSGQRIRLDRIFDEAQATGGDLRALCDLFGLSIAGAYRYVAAVDHIADPRALTEGGQARPSGCR